MSRRCSHCGHNGHNSRTCPDRGIRLFGVRLTDAANSSSNNSNSSSIAIRKSASVGNLSSALLQQQQQQNSATPEHSESGDGYVSDGLVQSSGNTRERKKGVPWTEDEHRMFLLGLHKLGKGDWRGIARNYVTSRTPTQVASHAQKYFIRQGNLSKRKRRSSLFDISTEAQCMVLDETFCTESSGFLAHSSLLRPPLAPESSPDPVQFQKSVEDDSALWLGISSPPPPPPPTVTGATLVKPTAVVKSSGIRIEDPHSELTKLSLGPNFSSSSSLRLEQPSSRHSAFHANPNASNASSALNKPISVV